MNRYTDYIHVPRTAVVNIMENYGNDTISGTGTIHGAYFFGDGLTLQNGTNVNEISTDTTLSGNSDDAVPTEKAVKTYIDERVTKSFGFVPFQSDEDVVTCTGTIGVCIPADLDGYEVTDVISAVHTAGTTGTTDIQVRRRRLVFEADLLTTKCTIDSTEFSSATAATAPVVGSTWKALEAGDIVYVDVDAVSTTAPKGLSVTVTVTKP